MNLFFPYIVEQLGQGIHPTSYSNDPVSLYHSRNMFAGNGYIAGTFPKGLLTVDGVASSREIELRERNSRKTIDWTMSNNDGTYKFDLLDMRYRYDLIARDYQQVWSDVVVPAIQPFAYVLTIFDQPPPLLLVGQPISHKTQISGGASPWTVDVVSPVDGLTAEIDDDRFLSISGTPTEDGQFQVDVVDTANARISMAIDVVNETTKWRVVFENWVGASNYMSVYELEFGDAVIVPNSWVSSSAYWSGYELYAFDGFYTGASGNGFLWGNGFLDPQWLSIEITEPDVIDEVRVWCGSGGEGPETVRVEKSVDGINWFEHFRVPGLGIWFNGHGHRLLKPKPSKKNFLRFLVTAPRTPYCGIAEVKVNGTALTLLNVGDVSASEVYNNASYRPHAALTDVDYYWCSDYMNPARECWLRFQLDLPLPIDDLNPINTIEIKNWYAFNDFIIQTSEDGVTWDDEWTESGHTDWVNETWRTFTRP